MLRAKEVARYFLSKDKENKLFNINLIELNGRPCYEGNVRLNKYLYLAQTVYLARYGELLFSDDFVAYDNGPVVKEIMNSYASMRGNKKDNNNLSAEIKRFLDKIYISLKDATCDELVEITHEDSAWKELSPNTYNAPVMDLLKYKNKFEKQYRGLIKVMEI